MIKPEISEERKYKIWHDCLVKWGIYKQFDMCTEEAGELIQALNHFKRGRNTMVEVIEEAVDTYIMIEQIVFILKGYPEFNKIYREKIGKLERRLQ